MPWIYLVIAGLFDVFWITCMKYSQGWTKLWPSVLTVLGIFISFACLSLAVKQLPISTSYITLVAVGSVGTALVGVMVFGESFTIGRIVCFALILTGIVGLKLQS